MYKKKSWKEKLKKKPICIHSNSLAITYTSTLYKEEFVCKDKWYWRLLHYVIHYQI